jgi:pantothenate kinase
MQLDHWPSIFSGLDRDLITGMQDALNQMYPYIKFLKSARREQLNSIDLLSKKIYQSKKNKSMR